MVIASSQSTLFASSVFSVNGVASSQSTLFASSVFSVNGVASSQSTLFASSVSSESVNGYSLIPIYSVCKISLLCLQVQYLQ